ncbi:MAG: type IV pilus assembly protein PilM [Phycisphaerae bacterium]|jgi:type IV pilus assembly protein PilM
MAAGNAVWGIDVGQCSLKALKLRNVGDGKVEAVAFDVIEHPKILSQPDADPEELIRGALEKFASRNDWQGDQFVIGVPGQQTFARFCKMPPVDQKKVPDLVRFEASQQIPFDMDDVIWDYQTFATEDSPDLEVGIFAMRKDLIRKHLEAFGNVGISASIVQTVPSALYNFCRFERAGEDDGALVLINVGAQNTDLVIVEPNSAWTRNIPLGGNSFTEALVRAFKLSFAKAESLKRTAATSKYARQIFQAMRPVFAELVAEIQRSIGFYSSTHRDVELKRVLALGNAFRLPGLQKYLENNLTIPGGVVRLEKFAGIVPSATVNAPQFTENILTFPASYGLALQGLGLAQINANLLPGELARIAVWKKKRLFFVATAACLGLAAFMPWTRTMLDKQALASPQASEAQAATQQIIQRAQKLKSEFAQVQTNTSEKEQEIKKLLELQDKNALVARVMSLVYEAMPPQNPLLANVHTADDLKALVKSGQLLRTQRRQLLIDQLSIEFKEDVEKADMLASAAGGGGTTGTSAGPITPMGIQVAGVGGRRSSPVNREQQQMQAMQAGQSLATSGFVVYIDARLLFGETQGAAADFLTAEYFPNLRELSAREGLGFYIPDDDPAAKIENIYVPLPRQLRAAQGAGGAAALGTGSPAGPAMPDPVTGEDMGGDWSIRFGFRVKLGEKPQKPGAAPQPGE